MNIISHRHDWACHCCWCSYHHCYDAIYESIFNQYILKITVTVINSAISIHTSISITFASASFFGYFCNIFQVCQILVQTHHFLGSETVYYCYSICCGEYKQWTEQKWYCKNATFLPGFYRLYFGLFLLAFVCGVLTSSDLKWIIEDNPIPEDRI